MIFYSWNSVFQKRIDQLQLVDQGFAAVLQVRVELAWRVHLMLGYNVRLRIYKIFSNFIVIMIAFLWKIKLHAFISIILLIYIIRHNSFSLIVHAIHLYIYMYSFFLWTKQHKIKYQCMHGTKKLSILNRDISSLLNTWHDMR